MNDKLPKITLSQLIKELDKYRPARTLINWTPEMDKLILKGREGLRPISYQVLSKLIKQATDIKIDPRRLSERYRKLTSDE